MSAMKTKDHDRVKETLASLGDDQLKAIHEVFVSRSAAANKLGMLCEIFDRKAKGKPGSSSWSTWAFGIPRAKEVEVAKEIAGVIREEVDRRKASGADARQDATPGPLTADDVQEMFDGEFSVLSEVLTDREEPTHSRLRTLKLIARLLEDRGSLSYSWKRWLDVPDRQAEEAIHAAAKVVEAETKRREGT